MANRAYLVGSENADTAGPNEQGINYDPDTEIFAGASYHLPIFWLSIFDESHLKTHAIAEHKIETFVADADTVKRLLSQRRAAVLATFPQCESHWNAWTQLITEAPFKFFKIDATEIWELDPDQLKQRLPGAVRWFSSKSDADFAQLLATAEVPLIKPRGLLGSLLGGTPRGYDPKTKNLTVAKDSSVGHHLHGYSWVRETPWKDE
ncbi:MAG TPA: hypothetical protein VK815_10655 [Candidatus Acidoferrales bacterium]|jgi:hypothetical protein|nr:hypothetical protein [Candidatus Acidoferrales bacterium]